MFKTFVFVLIRATFLPLLVRELIQRRRVTIIVYHAMKPETAYLHFEALKSKYNIISLKKYLQARKSGTLADLPPKSMIITFDDGHKSNFELTTLFRKHKISATIFLCSGLINTNRHFWWKHIADDTKRQFMKEISDNKRLRILEEYGFQEKQEFENRQALSKNEIDEMKHYVDFQSHTVFHPILPKCPEHKAYEEITNAKKILEQDYGLEIYALAYPNGDYSDREILMSKRAGYKAALTLDIGFNSQSTDIFRLKRICLEDDADVHEMIVKASGLWGYIKRIIKTLSPYFAL